MEIRKAYLDMIKATDGGWDVMAAHLGMSRSCLQNRIYEVKGQSVLVETAMTMQQKSGTTIFAEMVARISGGAFFKLPDLGEMDRADLLSRFNRLHARVGELSAQFSDFTKDDEIDRKEREKLERTGAEIHEALGELLAMAFSVYCREKDGNSK